MPSTFSYRTKKTSEWRGMVKWSKHLYRVSWDLWMEDWVRILLAAVYTTQEMMVCENSENTSGSILSYIQVPAREFSFALEWVGLGKDRRRFESCYIQSSVRIRCSIKTSFFFFFSFLCNFIT